MSTTFGHRIRARRQRKGWKLKDLAEKTGLSVAYLSDLERQQGANPTLETVGSIATALGCDVSDLLGSTSATQGLEMRPFSKSLERFLHSTDFDLKLKELAAQAGREPDEDLRQEVVEFLAHAPRRSKGELTTQQWEALLDFYTHIVIRDR